MADLSKLDSQDLYRLKELYCPMYGNEKDWMHCLKRAKQETLIETLENEIIILKNILDKLNKQGEL